MLVISESIQNLQIDERDCYQFCPNYVKIISFADT